jgi:hypothetical protein
MVITQASADDVLRATRLALGLPAEAPELVGETVLAAALRRLAGILCPCSPATLASALVENFAYLVTDPTLLRERAEEVIERLTIQGDLLELSNVTTLEPGARNSWMFAASPAFVARPHGAVVLLGIAPDERSPLPSRLADRLQYEGCARLLTPDGDEDLPGVLRGLGLLELSEQAWLRPAKADDANKFREQMDRRLDGQSPSGDIPDLHILDPERPVRFYRGRWCPPGKRSGYFVGRRPQAYGAPIWGYVRLNAGEPVQFLDFPLKGDRFRGCDAAWRLQLAIDRCRGVPQLYRRRLAENDGTILDFSHRFRCGRSAACRYLAGPPCPSTPCSLFGCPFERPMAKSSSCRPTYGSNV